MSAAPRRRAATLFHTATLSTFYAASSVPTPLYRLYQKAFGFSPVLLTVIFAVYSFSLLLSLLVAGAISDHLGRRPAVFVSLLLLVLALTLFLMAKGPAWLIAARIVQGPATGVAASSVGAALIDLDPEHGPVTNSIAPLVGMAIGAVATAALVQYAPCPLHLAYAIVLVILVAQTMCIWMTPETASRREGLFAALKPIVAVPRRIRGPLLRTTPLTIAVWTLAGFYLSLGPSVVAVATGNTASLVGGAVVGALTLSGSLAVFALRRRGPRAALRLGVPAMLIGVAAVVTGTHLSSAPLLVVATLIVGVGFGANFTGTVRTLMPLAAPDERAGLLATFYIECYLAASLPAIGAGLVARSLGLVAATDIFAAAVMLMTLAGAAGLRAYPAELAA